MWVGRGSNDHSIRNIRFGRFTVIQNFALPSFGSIVLPSFGHLSLANGVSDCQGRTDRQSGEQFDYDGKTTNEKKKQVTRGHNIVADGWAGASNPQPHPMPPPPTYIPKIAPKTLVFHFSTHGLRTDGRTDGRTHKASYRVACPQRDYEIYPVREMKLTKVPTR